MKTKKILRFYFSADSLERAFSNLIMYKACASGADALETAEEICAVVGDKIRLERLWAYLDDIIRALSAEERDTLLKYSARGVFRGDGGRRSVCRAVNKFTRHARRLKEFADEITVLDRYYVLMA